MPCDLTWVATFLMSRGIYLIKMVFDQSKIIWMLYWLVKSNNRNISQKCQPRLIQKIHDLVTMDMFKTTCSKRLKVFLMFVQNGYNIHLCFRPRLNRRSTQKVLRPQSCRSPNFRNFKIPTWESQDKMPFGCQSRGQAHSIL